MKRRVLVTGGMGFAGGRVAQTLAGCNDIELVLGSRKAQRACWLVGAPQPVILDWNSQSSLLNACQGIDAIVHLAAMNDVECLLDPVTAVEVNVVNTARLLEAAKVAGVHRVIYFSTAHVYSPSLVGRIDEATLPKGRHPYATSHRAAEDVVLAANANLVSIVLRLSNGFGVPAHIAVNAWKLLVNDLCRQAVTLHSLTLKSSGLQKRDFVTLHDVGGVVAHMLDLPKEKVGDGLFNVGSGQSVQVIDMAELIQERCSATLGFHPEIIRPPPKEDEHGPDLDYRIDKLLNTGFTLSGIPSVEIDAILRMCNEYFVVAN